VRLFGYEISRQPPAAGSERKALITTSASQAYSPIDGRGGWWGIVREAFAGAWQQNIEVKLDTALTNSTVYRCIGLIASDIAKMNLRLVALNQDGIWTEVEQPAFSSTLRRPNRYQNRIQFIENWLVSKLVHGNTYVLKMRDNRNVVAALYILDPTRVKVLVSPDGAVFYELMRDNLAGLENDSVTVPASEIIHDRMNCLYHPLVGTSPIYANGLAAMQAIRIQSNSAQFFGNGSNPGGILTAPGHISDDTAVRLKEHWDANYTGANVGKVAVLGDGLEYRAMSVNAVDAQLIDQLKWTGETICSTFGVPAYKVGIGPLPPYTNIEALNQQYYSDCLQILIEALELSLDEGMELPSPYGTEFDLDGLIRMDTATQVKTYGEAVKSGLFRPNEGRRKLNMGPVPGGDAVYLQQQNYSLEALAKRDASDDPFGTAKPAAPAPTEPDAEPVDEPDETPEEELERFAALLNTKLLEAPSHA
jgi:HK97 family phage portal protein